MDSVFFIIQDQDVYVGDYHKEALKQIKFKEKDSWEVYDKFDWMELVEYMNYPLNFNRFKGSKVHILFDNPQMYNMIHETQQLFKQSEGMGIGNLKDALLAYCQNLWTEAPQGAHICYEGRLYAVETSEGRIETIGFKEEVEEVDYTVVTTLQLCDFQKDRQLMGLEARKLVLSPYHIEQTFEGCTQYLETHYVIDEKSVLKDCKVQKGEVLFAYEQHLQKAFKRQARKALQHCAEQDGYYFYKKADNATTPHVWAKKGQLIGVITSKEEPVEAIEAWLVKIGY